MSIKIYTQDLDGKHLIATVDQINQVEAYRECCRNIVTEDEEMADIVRNMPEIGSAEDDRICHDLGIDVNKMENAAILCGCICIMPVLLLIAFIFEK